jgi:hypothetical protein
VASLAEMEKDIETLRRMLNREVRRREGLEVELGQTERDRDEARAAEADAAAYAVTLGHERDAANERAEQAEGRACDPNTCSYLADAKEELDALAEAKAAAEAASAAMRSALERHQWDGWHDNSQTGHSWHYCIECRQASCEGHLASCAIGNALAPGAGAAMLAELTRLRQYFAASERLHRAEISMMADDTARYLPELEAAAKAKDAARAALSAPQAGGEGK